MILNIVVLFLIFSYLIFQNSKSPSNIINFNGTELHFKDNKMLNIEESFIKNIIVLNY